MISTNNFLQIIRVICIRNKSEKKLNSLRWRNERMKNKKITKNNNSNDNARIANHMQWKNGMANRVESLLPFTDESGDAEPLICIKRYTASLFILASPSRKEEIYCVCRIHVMQLKDSRWETYQKKGQHLITLQWGVNCKHAEVAKKEVHRSHTTSMRST